MTRVCVDYSNYHLHTIVFILLLKVLLDRVQRIDHLESLLPLVYQADSLPLTYVLLPLRVYVLVLIRSKLEPECEPGVLHVVILINNDDFVLFNDFLGLKVSSDAVLHLLKVFTNKLEFDRSVSVSCNRDFSEF